MAQKAPAGEARLAAERAAAAQEAHRRRLSLLGGVVVAPATLGLMTALAAVSVARLLQGEQPG